MAGTSRPRFADVRITRLTRTELPVDTTELARFLVGKVVIRDLPEGRMAGRIVETEAYLHGDAAAHSYRGETPRNRSLFGERGHAYVYVSYGIHRMLNVVGGTPGIGTGVLLRAAEPLEGIALMQARRGLDTLTELARGPGKLAQAFEITLGLSDTDMTREGPLWLGRIDRPAGEIGVSVRIGITKEADRPLRFYERGSKFVSGRKALNI
jgi:DNA-3-methyladenine glycosylase